MPPDFDCVVIGAGAAGLMCAIEAGKRGRRVAVLEHNDRAGRKILISGGGRCNFTNIHCRPENFTGANPHFAKSALARYAPADFIALVEKHRIRYHEKTLGQMFCDGSSAEIVAMLEAECKAAQVEIRLPCRVNEVRHADRFIIGTDQGEVRAASLVVAAGGLSIPKIGATDLGYRLAKQFGHRVIPPRPALVPLIVPGFTDLAGVSTEVVASIGRQSFREQMLFTHRGLSGPAILQISSYLPGDLILDLLPDTRLPRRLEQRLAGIDREELRTWPVDVRGTEGFDKAEVTAGGVDTDQISSKTMESRLVRGLYFIGEVVDVTGQLGGFNFQWAWASGSAAGKAM